MSAPDVRISLTFQKIMHKLQQSVCYLFGQNAISNANSSFSDASNSSNTRNHRFSSNRMSLLDLEVLIDELES